MSRQHLTQEPYLGKNPPLVPISNSEVQTFKECRRKWWLSYYRGLRPKDQQYTGALALGTRIHKCLEEFYKNGVDPVQTNQELIEATALQMAAEGQDTEELMKEAELGRIMMEGYLEWLEETAADADIEVTGSEEKVTLPIMDGRVELRGKMDLRIRRKTDGANLFLDFKTLANYDTYLKIADMAEQLKFYLILEHGVKEERRVGGAKYRLLKKVKRTAKAKPPFYKDVDIRHNKHTLESFWYNLHGVVQNMLDLRQQLDNGADHRQAAYPTPTNDCTWKCPFYTACPMFDDGSAVEDYLADNYVTDDPYARYEEEEA
jgi:RecB family exonuclease